MNFLLTLKNTEPINDLEMHRMKLPVDHTHCKDATWLLTKITNPSLETCRTHKFPCKPTQFIVTISSPEKLKVETP
jgi:hypothetical protein